MHSFTLLLASNENATSNMAQAKVRLDTFFHDSLRWSTIHESQAHGAKDQGAPPYLNAVCQGQTAMSLEGFKAWLKAMEAEMGRQRGVAANGRVTLDLDVVVWENSILRPIDAERSYYQICLADLPTMD